MILRRVALNVTFAVVEITVTTVALFLVYTVVVQRLGIKNLGIWSVVTAVASMIRLGELGVTGTVVKFVAKSSRNSPVEAQQVVQTAILSGSIMVAVFALASAVLIPAALRFFLPEEGIVVAVRILPWSLFSVWLMVTASIVLGALDGNQRIDIRAGLNILGGILLLVGTILLTDRFQLIGLVYAQILQGMFLLIASWLLLRRTMPELPIIPYHWDRVTFRRMFGYGISFQTITAMQMLYEPTTKLLVSYYGGLTTTGFFEMASRMVVQFRGLFVAAAQVTVPLVANMQEVAAERTKDIYRNTYDIMFFFAAPLYCLLIALTPYISELWLGQFELLFVCSSILLAIAWWLNSLSAPAYFHFLGTGRLRWNVLGQVLIGILNLGLGYVLGELLGGTGPIFAWVLALAVGSVVTQVAFLVEAGLRPGTLIPNASRLLLLASIVLMILSLFLYENMLYDSPAAAAMSGVVATFAILVFPLVRKHPVINQLLMLFSKESFNKSGHQ